MRILTQPNSRLRNMIGDLEGISDHPFIIEFEKSSIKPLKLKLVAPLTIDNINRFIESTHAEGDDAKLIIKQMDELLRSVGYLGKRILCHALHRDENGNLFLESDKYAEELIT